MTTPAAAGSSSPTPQPTNALLSRSAIFLVATINPGEGSAAAVRSLCADLAALLRSIGFREPAENLSCIMGFGSAAWDRLFGEPRPAELHPFREFRGGSRHAVATPGDILFHIRAERMDLCFELATQIMAGLGDAVETVDEVHGFRYFDSRDLLGFVDGTENPTGQAAIDATRIGDENPAFAGGSYVIEQMLENMFVGRPPGNYDRILDFSRAVTGNLFFVPTAAFLEDVTRGAPPEPVASPAVEPSQPVPPVPDGSLGIGSLKGKPRS